MLPTLHTDDEGWCLTCFGPTALCSLLPFDSTETLAVQVAIEA